MSNEKRSVTVTDRIECASDGSTALRGLGRIIGIFPRHRDSSGRWIDASPDFEPLGFGGHRLIDRVDLSPCVSPDGAEDFGAADRQWYRAECVGWRRGAETGAAQEVCPEVAFVTTYESQPKSP